VNEYTFDLPMPPSVNSLHKLAVGKNGKPYRYTAKEYKAWKNEAAWMLIQVRNKQRKHAKRLTGKLEVSAKFIRPDDNCDLDNRLKAVIDLLQQTNTIENDKQIERIYAEWTDEGVPCQITVRKIEAA
jgi:Holliday junction resolvase RusA-like endonuclease